MMSRRNLDRRRFLKLVGATALTYPFLRGLPSYAAGGSGSTDPIYLVLLFTSCGCVRFNWGAQGPAPTGTTPTVTSPLVFRDTLSAFTKAGPMQVDLTNQVTVLDGLSVAAAGQASHEGGMAGLWTGTTVTGTPLPTGPSIDQVIAPLMKSQLGVNTPYSNIPLMAQSSADYQTRDNDTHALRRERQLRRPVQQPGDDAEHAVPGGHDHERVEGSRQDHLHPSEGVRSSPE
jgi:hypothetical protein